MERDIETKEYRFSEGKHLHELLKDGEWKALTGVTTVLGVIAKPMLIQWAANMAVDYLWDRRLELNDETFKEARVAHRKKKEKAGDWGTEVHAEVEKYIYNVMNNKMGMYDERITHFISWAVDNKVTFLASEKHVYSKRMWTGGIADIVCEIDGKRYVGDIKTSSGIYPEAFIQCSAYAEMLKEMSETMPEQKLLNVAKPMFDGVIVLNLKKDGTFDWKLNYDLEGNLKTFESALQIYRQLNAIK